MTDRDGRRPITDHIIATRSDPIESDVSTASGCVVKYVYGNITVPDSSRVAIIYSL